MYGTGCGIIVNCVRCGRDTNCTMCGRGADHGRRKNNTWCSTGTGISVYGVDVVWSPYENPFSSCQKIFYPSAFG